MYNSSIKKQGQEKHFSSHLEIPGKIFFNDMSKVSFREEFLSCDVLFSEIAWPYGYKGFNEKAGNEPGAYSDYLDNINALIGKLNIPAFIVCGKNVKAHFKGAKMQDIAITTAGTSMPGCTLYIWNYDTEIKVKDTNTLTLYLAERFDKCLDISCGYGEHLFRFKDFIGCDINRDCLTYLSILWEERGKRSGTT